jgi:hypothetical protein
LLALAREEMVPVMSEAQEIEDEEHEQILERVCAIDVAKASGKLCTRVPHPSRPRARRTRVWDVDATTNAILELGEHLAARDREDHLNPPRYWRIYLPPEAAGLDVQLVVPGMSGTRRAAKKGQRLAGEADRAGMLRPSSQPAEIRLLWDYTRLRTV